MSHLFILLKTLFLNRSSIRFAIAVCFGISFSIAVILSTIGLMDGFVEILETNLKRSSGDINFYSREGFFNFDTKVKENLGELGVIEYAPIVQTEAFIVVGESSKGVAIRGVPVENYNKVAGLDLDRDLMEEGIVLGTELAKNLRVDIGDSVVLTLARGNRSLSQMPLLKRFKLVGLIDHGIYQKNLRLAYLPLKKLQALLKTGGQVNMVTLNIPEKRKGHNHKDAVDSFLYDLESKIGLDYRLRPYWYDFSALLEAVRIEKITISLILQIIVVISIFNALAFIIYLNEKRSKDIFLFQALGLTSKRLTYVWLLLLVNFWFFSCCLSLVWIKIFDYTLANWSVFKLPGHIYQLEQLSLKIQSSDYVMVFSLALFWIMIISLVGLWRVFRRPILTGLRKEFA